MTVYFMILYFVVLVDDCSTKKLVIP